MGTIAIALAILAVAWTALAAASAFFAIGPMFVDRGASPIFGAKRPFFSAAHRAELRMYRTRCQQAGTSLIWWRVVRYAEYGIPALVLAAIAVGAIALR